MRFISRTIVAALLALSWSTVASADSEGPPPTIEPAAFVATTDTRLEAAFEDFSERGQMMLSVLAGPTSMDCVVPEAPDEVETCVVHCDEIRSSMPAALAQN